MDWIMRVTLFAVFCLLAGLAVGLVTLDIRPILYGFAALCSIAATMILIEAIRR